MDTPDFFVGARLGAARIKAGISLEKAAKDTRIRVQRLREIEGDDFSSFAHPTYSRLFLLDYADYLGVPKDDIRPLLPDSLGSGAGGFEYINVLARRPSSPVVPMHRKRPSLRRILTNLAIIFLVLVGGLFTYSTIKKIERVTGSSSLTTNPAPEAATPAPTPEAEPTPEATPEAEPTPEEDAGMRIERALPSFPEPAPEPPADPIHGPDSRTPEPTPSL